MWAFKSVGRKLVYMLYVRKKPISRWKETRKKHNYEESVLTSI